jgi:hypothetical protein
MLGVRVLKANQLARRLVAHLFFWDRLETSFNEVLGEPLAKVIITAGRYQATAGYWEF